MEPSHCVSGEYIALQYDVIPKMAQIWQKSDYFIGRKFRGDKLSRTSRAKIKFRGYKLSRMEEILSLFSYFGAIFRCFLIDISRMNSEVRFRGH